MEGDTDGLRVSVKSDPRLAARIISHVMGEYHGYYAGWAARSCGGGLVARVSGKPAGAAVYYEVRSSDAGIGVVYYIAVLPSYRGLGLGRILVASAEEAMEESEVYVATTTEGNHASMKLFSSMGYRVETWEGLRARHGPAAAETLYLAACAYEDGIVMYKEERPGTLRRIGLASLEKAHEAWDEVCLKPYLQRRAARQRMASRVKIPLLQR